MSLVTYILLAAIYAGKQGQFDPQILGQTASKAFGILFLEFCCIKLGCYLLGIGEEGTMVDLLAYEGYKFVGSVCVKELDVTQVSKVALNRGPLFDRQRDCDLARRLARLVGLGVLARVSLHLVCEFLFPGKSIQSRACLLNSRADNEASFEQLRSLRHIILPDPAMSPLDHATAANSGANAHSHAARSRRIQFLFIIALAQALSMGVLVRV